MKPQNLFLAFLLITLFLAACSESVNVAYSCSDFQEVNHRTAEISVNQGDEFTVTLCSNATTGYSWSEDADITATSIVEQVAHQFVAPDEGGEPVVGSAGEQVWRFQALSTGESSIMVEYSQLWEGGDKGTWTFVLNEL